ncbi:MAG: hypothetical protein MK078_06830 [Crocinitomicaceae bacterium]|nr:hypothetical protein [Crocinitomicaceae bacterium]
MKKLSLILFLGLFACTSEEGVDQESSENSGQLVDTVKEVTEEVIDSIGSTIEEVIEYTDSIGDELEEINLEGDSVFDEFTDKFKELEKNLEKIGQ